MNGDWNELAAGIPFLGPVSMRVKPVIAKNPAEFLTIFSSTDPADGKISLYLHCRLPSCAWRHIAAFDPVHRELASMCAGDQAIAHLRYAHHLCVLVGGELT